jgi:hypothetical protein
MNRPRYSGVMDWLTNDPLGTTVFILAVIILAAGIIYVATHIPADKEGIQQICMNSLIHSNRSVSVEEAARRCWP